MRNWVLQDDFDRAVIEIKGFLLTMASECSSKGWSFFSTNDAPESFKALKEMTKDKHVPIADYGSDTSIYGKDINTLFRFYHDVVHLENGWSFSKQGETNTVEKHQQDAKNYGLSPLALQILWADTFGQVEYYFSNKRFVDNQYDFVWMCLQVGITQACRIKI
ncbi:MAG: hypothetical protein Unbinned96contig1001_55 [Prokaryotic dsDNA virus sp.]|nr:MAG: hypothetical protein Unbinned96contig1001_55 [Prokaryotic dsDNA virus sp.]|tara:strand:- start:738 stop:1226 length:489 start_codon:yes stop_codon:yes gene_type:complete